MKLYLDASALVKRYVAETGSDLVRDAMDGAERWLICRAGYVETVRAVGLSAGRIAIKAVQREWPAFDVIEIDQPLVEDAAKLAIDSELRSLDALHLAAARIVSQNDLTMATWDKRLHAAARAEDIRLIPEALD